MNDPEFERLVALENLRSALRVLEEWRYFQTARAVRGVIAGEEAAIERQRRPLPPRGGSGASDAKDTGQAKRPGPPPMPKHPWVAKVFPVGRWRYAIHVTSGAIHYGWGFDGAVGDFHAWGFARATRKAQRIVDGLNRRDARHDERERQAKEVR